MSHGFEFFYNRVEEALYQEYGHPEVTVTSNPTYRSHEENLPRETDKSKGDFQLRARVSLDVDTGEIFPFFASPLNLGLLTPSWLGFRINSMPSKMEPGSIIRYTIGLWILHLAWTTRILSWDPSSGFIDVQERGPYSLWIHEHIFFSQGDGTVIMEDIVTYRLPFWFVGRCVHMLFLRDVLLRVFSFRNLVIRLRFNSMV